MITKARNAIRFLYRSYQTYRDEEKIVIYQMGKVGSTSLTRALGEDAIQIHNFYPANEPCHCKPRYPGRIDRRLLHALFYRAIRLGVGRRQRLKIITLVRDPVARNLSMYFQDLHFWQSYYFSEVRPGLRNKNDIDTLLDCYRETFDQQYPLVWFDNEFRRITGVNVYDHPFDSSAGYTRIEEDGKSILIVQTEKLSERWDVIEEFCGRKLELRRDNHADEKWYRDLYARFVDRFSLTTNELDEIYSSEFASFFFSKAERGKFRERWRR
jgi:hypothetical protein